MDRLGESKISYKVTTFGDREKKRTMSIPAVPGGNPPANPGVRCKAKPRG